MVEARPCACRACRLLVQRRACATTPASYSVSRMTAAQVIDQIKTLPPEERAKVVEYVHELEASHPGRVMEPGDFDRATGQVFDRHAELMRKLSK